MLQIYINNYYDVLFRGCSSEKVCLLSADMKVLIKYSQPKADWIHECYWLLAVIRTHMHTRTCTCVVSQAGGGQRSTLGIIPQELFSFSFRERVSCWSGITNMPRHIKPFSLTCRFWGLNLHSHTGKAHTYQVNCLHSDYPCPAGCSLLHRGDVASMWISMYKHFIQPTLGILQAGIRWWERRRLSYMSRHGRETASDMQRMSRSQKRILERKEYEPPPTAFFHCCRYFYIWPNIFNMLTAISSLFQSYTAFLSIRIQNCLNQWRSNVHSTFLTHSLHGRSLWQRAWQSSPSHSHRQML